MEQFRPHGGYRGGTKGRKQPVLKPQLKNVAIWCGKHAENMDAIRDA